MADRWFVVPLDPIEDRGFRPKYADTPGITGFSGMPMDFSDPAWSDVAWYPQTMYVVRFYADRQKELNDLERTNDVWSERDLPQPRIADALNERTGKNRTYEEWVNHFSVGV